MVTKRFLFASIGVAVTLTLGFCFVGANLVQAEAPAEELDPQQLVIGDWYEVTIEKSGVKEKLEGTLVQVTDDWMVLGVVYCAGHDVPRFEFLERVADRYVHALTWEIFELHDLLSEDWPLLKTLTRVRKQEYSKGYYWIHRQLGKIEKRQRVEKPELRKDFAGDAPKLDAPDCPHQGVYQIVDGKKTSISGNPIRVENHQLSVVNTRWKTEDMSNPTWSEVPLLGYLFVKEKSTKFEDVSTVPIENVFFISQLVPYDYRKIHADDKPRAN